MEKRQKKRAEQHQTASSSTACSTPTRSDETSSQSSNYSTPIRKEIPLVDLTIEDDGWIDSAKEFESPASTTSMKPPRKYPPICQQSPASDSIESNYNTKKRGRGFLLEDYDEDEDEDEEDEEDEDGDN